MVRNGALDRQDADAIINKADLVEAAEIALYEFIQQVNLSEHNVDAWRAYLATLEAGNSILATFFDNVMVMADDAKTRQTRLTLLLLAQRKFNSLCNMAELVT